ncbi:unnamed protein product [Rotaria socialis]|uniref:Uncharacterized protein n=1 Tax=Rotaria socialis TaxID=392032 RepID=A0A821RDT1_9BILA|nr:unnamed protein product [Rotaria socialis]CAF4840918.1 unnamed protein product [Rotaria socialis]
MRDLSFYPRYKILRAIFSTVRNKDTIDTTRYDFEREFLPSAMSLPPKHGNHRSRRPSNSRTRQPAPTNDRPYDQQHPQHRSYSRRGARNLSVGFCQGRRDNSSNRRSNSRGRYPNAPKVVDNSSSPPLSTEEMTQKILDICSVSRKFY